MYLQKINIKEGWNLVSFYLFNIDFNEIISNKFITEIRTSNKSFNRVLIPKLNTLSKIETDVLYWIKSDTDFILYSYGEVFNFENLEKEEIDKIVKNLYKNETVKKTYDIELNEGWNQISLNIYNPKLTSFIKNDNILEIRSHKSSYNKLLPINLNTLKEIKIDEGYFIKSKIKTKVEVDGNYYNFDLIDTEVEIKKLTNKFITNNLENVNYKDVEIKNIHLKNYLVNVYKFERNLNIIKLDTSLVTHLNLSFTNIDSLDEFFQFENLKFLNINNTKIKKIGPINTSLEEIYCNNCPIEDINVNNNYNLRILECKNTIIKELDLEKNSNLNHLNCKNCINLEKIYVEDLCIPSSKNWIKEDYTKYILKNTTISDTGFLKYLINIHSLDTFKNYNSINKNTVKKIDIEKYFSKNNHKILNLDGIENFKELEILNINNNLNIKKLDLTQNKKLRILKFSNSNINEINIENNYLLETIECENCKIKDLILPKSYVVFDSKKSKIDYKISQTGGLNNLEKINYYGRIANEKDIFNYKLKYYGFGELKDLYINDLLAEEIKFGGKKYTVIKFSKFNKNNYRNIINNLPFTVNVFKYPDSEPKQYIFNYRKDLDYYHYLVSSRKINVDDLIYNYKVEIMFNYPSNENFKLKINESSYITKPINDLKYNLLIYDNEEYFINHQVTYKNGFFMTKKNIINLDKKFRFMICNINLTTVNCSKNKLKEIDISRQLNLINFNAGNNEIKEINLKNNTLLKKLNLSNNQIKKIDLTNNNILEELYLNFNYFRKIDITKNILLRELNLSNNVISNIDLTKNLKLETLLCSDNHLSNLDISKNTELIKIVIFNNCLKKLNTKNNKELKYNPKDLGDVALTNSNIEIINLDDEINYEISNKYIGRSIDSNHYLSNNEIGLVIFSTIENSILPKKNSIIIEKPTYNFYIVDSIIDNYKLPNNTFFYTIKIKDKEKTKNYMKYDYYLLDHIDYSISKNITLLKIKDMNFLKYLESIGGKVHGNQEIFIDVNNIIHINIDRLRIKSIEEIKYFPNLLSLSCSGCDISELNLSFNNKLFYLNCSENPFSKLDLSKNKNLHILFGYQLGINKIDFTENKKLVYINLIENRNLLEIDLRNYTNNIIEKLLTYRSNKLEKIFIDTYKYNFDIPKDCIQVDNEFYSFLIENYEAYYEEEELIVPNKDKIDEIFLRNNKLKEIIGLEILDNLQKLILYNSELFKIDLSKSQKLIILNFTGLDNIKEIDVSKNNNLNAIIIYDCKNLEIINLKNNNNDIIENLKIGACPNLKKLIINKRLNKLPEKWEISDNINIVFE